MLKYIERVIKEKEELDFKIKKLSAFLILNALGVDKREVELLNEQLIAMKNYSDILQERLNLYDI